MREEVCDEAIRKILKAIRERENETAIKRNIKIDKEILKDRGKERKKVMPRK